MTTVSSLIIDDLTPPQRGLLLAAEHMGGGGSERELQEIARLYDKSDVRSSLHNHYSRAADQLVTKGLFRKSVTYYTEWWLTDLAWRSLGHTGSAPTSPQGQLL